MYLLSAYMNVLYTVYHRELRFITDLIHGCLDGLLYHFVDSASGTLKASG